MSPSAYVVERRTRAGEKRFHVRYRPEGSVPPTHAGAYRTREEAEARRDEVIHLIAAGERPKPHLQTIGHVYVVQAGDDGPCKIGFASSLEARLVELQVGNHEQLHVRATFRATREFERSMHHEYADRRLRGEWFALTASEIERLASGFASRERVMS